MSQQFLAITRAIADFLSQQPAGADDLGKAIRHMEKAATAAEVNPAYRAADRQRSYADILRSALAATDAPLAKIAAATTEAAANLPWVYSYPAESGQADLSERIAFAEIAGPKAPLVAAQTRLGFTLMAPDTFYPMHAHPAVELYLVVSGHANWLTPGTDKVVAPGGFILHRTNEPHAMQTHAEPLLAIYGWQGDLDSPSVYL